MSCARAPRRRQVLQQRLPRRLKRSNPMRSPNSICRGVPREWTPVPMSEAIYYCGSGQTQNCTTSGVVLTRLHSSSNICALAKSDFASSILTIWQHAIFYGHQGSTICAIRQHYIQCRVHHQPPNCWPRTFMPVLSTTKDTFDILRQDKLSFRYCGVDLYHPFLIRIS